MNKKQIRLTESDFLHKIENPNVRELVKAVLSERIFDEHLIKYQWTSGEATDVSPIMVWANKIDFQLDDPTLRNKYEQAIKNICNKYKNFFKNGYISNYDGSCPIYVSFLYADGVLEWIKDGKEIKENKQYNNMNKKLIKLTEQDLHRIVKESVKKVLNERTFGDEIMKKPYLDLIDAINNFDNVVHQLYYEKDMNKLQDFGAGQKRVEDLLQRYNDALRAYRFACEDFVRHEDSNRPWWERENIYT